MYTLEKQLHKRAENNEKVKSLESIFIIQKQKVNRYLSSVATSFPTYSAHDATHSINIIASIEQILGTKKIKQLSGIDTFLILMCAYMHDIGMLYTEEEVEKIWNTVEFSDFVDSCMEKGEEVANAARCIQKVKRKEEADPLEIRRSVSLLLMEYFRPKHGMRIDAVADAKVSGFGNLLAIDDSFLPDRIIHMIYKISVAHTWEQSKILSDLPLADTYGIEEFHPRMIAYLLRMGDLCDLDNDRFNLVGVKLFGKLGMENLAHYFKHKSVETLYISDSKIYVVANVEYDSIARECKDEWMKEEPVHTRKDKAATVFQNTVKEHINWKAWLEQEASFAKLHANDIFPSKKMSCVVDVVYEIRIDGQESVSTHENLRFMFAPERAFRLIENISLYQDRKLIFVRELVQNALDATKYQIWRDLVAYGYDFTGKSPFDIEMKYPGFFERYSINIHTSYDEKTNIAQISILDKGIGMTMDEVKNNILSTGRSWEERREYAADLKKMPGWLKPTGAFGIGLHTVFSVANHMTICTKSDGEKEANEVTLYSGKNGGYAFCRKCNDKVGRGSEFSFSFPMTEKLQKNFFGNDQRNPLLEDLGDELQEVIGDEISKQCISPIVPIYLNDVGVAPALVQSTWYNVLGQEEKREHILYALMESKRYEFAFAYDYKSIMLWDREQEAAICLNLEESNETSNVCYKGIFVDEYFLTSPQSDWLYVAMADVLGGSGQEWVDASRMNLVEEAKKKYQQIYQDAAAFSRKLYLKLMKELDGDFAVVKIQIEEEKLAREIVDGKLGYKNFMQMIRNLKLKHYGSTKNINIRSLSRRTLTYLLALKVIDKALKMYCRRYYRVPMQKRHNQLFSIIDQLIATWKADWKGNDNYFYENYFDEQMCKLADYVLTIYGLVGGDLSDQAYQLFFPYCSTWRKLKKRNQEAFRNIQVFQGKEKVKYGFSWQNILFLPIDLQLFTEWSGSNQISNIPALQLYISLPCYSIVLDIPGIGREIGSLEREVWKNTISQTYLGDYGIRMGFFYSGNAGSLLEDGGIKLRFPIRGIQTDIFPFLFSMAVVGQEKFDELQFSLTVEHYQGIKMTQETKHAMFVAFWENLYKQTDKRKYCPILAPSDYPLLAIWNSDIENNDWLEMSAYYPYIPVWDYAIGIAEFLEPYLGCAIDEKTDEILKRIMELKTTKSVISYIETVRTKEERNATRSEIEAQYCSFLRDLLYVWAEKHGCTFG